ncbi:MAG: hypothetical protein AAF495_11565 [Pseudomonadota bacterium]
MATPIEDLVTILPCSWPGEKLPVMPGELRHFAPQGLGLDVGLVVRPWDDPSGPSPSRFYGLDEPSADPFAAAPTAEASGGTAYFDSGPSPEHLKALLSLLGTHLSLKQYAVFMVYSANPIRQGYIRQMRIVSFFALKSLFGVDAIEGPHQLPEQEFDVEALLAAFIADDEWRWGERKDHEEGQNLGFGYTIENTYQCVYRIWSRVWPAGVEPQP